MKVRTLLLCAVVLALTLPMFAADAKSPMKAGKWQTTMQTEMPNMPFKIPAITINSCVTKEQAEKPEPPKGKKNDDCKMTDYKMDGSTVTWTVVCEKQKTTGTGRITYSAESYQGEMKMQMGETEMTTKYTGKYLGECDK